MGKTFFVDWALWEKMVFVLACCIVLTIFGGCLKLWYMHHRLRKYAKTPPKPIDREKSIIRSLSVRKGPKQKKVTQQMVQKRPLMEKDGVHVPFGIRAIESGIEVDGVWISRSTTPAPSTREPSTNSLYKQVPQQSRKSSIDVSSAFQSSKGDPETSPFDTFSMAGPSSGEPSQSLTIDRSFSEGSIGIHPSTLEPVAQGTRRYPPHSFMRYDGSSAKHFRNSHTLEYKTPSGHPKDRSTSDRSSTSGSASSRTSSNGSNELQYPEAALPQTQVRSISNPSFDALQMHRKSQVAETGRLVPRSRRPGLSGDWTAPIISGEVHNFSLPRLSTTPPPPGSSSSNNSLNPFTTPTSDRPASTDFSSEQKMAISEPKSRRNSGFSYSRPDSSVLREVNPGFSVLKPGTLDSEALARENAHRRRTRSRSGSSDGERRHSRRLQKRRRPSESSRDSSFDASSDLERGLKYSSDQQPPSDRDIEKGLLYEATGGKYRF